MSAKLPSWVLLVWRKRRSPGRPPKWVAQMMAPCNQSSEEQREEEVQEPELSEAGLKGSNSGSTTVDCQVNSLSAEGKTMTGDSTCQAKQHETGGSHNREVLTNSQETPSKQIPKRQKLKKDHPLPAALRRLELGQWYHPPIIHKLEVKLSSSRGSDVTM